MTFNERKVAQMAAFFLQERGEPMAILKLMKLLYLAERESLRLYGMPMSGDHLVAMPHGPVLSITYDLMSGSYDTHEGGWQQWIADRENYEVSLQKKVSREDLDELSNANIAILRAVWEKFGYLNRWEIRDYTHDFCPEWQDPHGSSQPIAYEAIFRVLGRSPEEARLLAERIEEEKTIDQVFQSL